MKRKEIEEKKRALKKIRNQKINPLMKVTLMILRIPLVVLQSPKEKNPKKIIQLVTKKIIKKLKKDLEIEIDREIERKKKRRTRTNLKK